MRNFGKTTLLTLCNVLANCFFRVSQPAILMYHSFEETDWKHGVAPDALAQQLAWLTKHRTVVPLSKIAAHAGGTTSLASNTVAITIDDGYRDTYEVFFQLAKKYQLPFTVFLTTDLSPQEKLGQLPRPTIEQLQEMLDSGLMTLGVHGHSHTNFPEVLADGREHAEIEQSKKYLEETFGVAVTAVAYPAGRTSEAVFAYFKERGYRAGCTTRAGFVTPGSDVLQLPRIGVDRATTFALFTGRLQPGYTWYLKLAHIFKKHI